MLTECCRLCSELLMLPTSYDNQIIFFKIFNPGSTKEVPIGIAYPFDRVKNNCRRSDDCDCPLKNRFTKFEFTCNFSYLYFTEDNYKFFLTITFWLFLSLWNTLSCCLSEYITIQMCATNYNNADKINKMAFSNCFVP